MIKYTLEFYEKNYIYFCMNFISIENFIRQRNRSKIVYNNKDTCKLFLIQKDISTLNYKAKHYIKHFFFLKQKHGVYT